MFAESGYPANVNKSIDKQTIHVILKQNKGGNVSKTMRISDETYEQLRWIKKDERRNMCDIVSLSVTSYLGTRYVNYAKDKKKQ